MLKTVQLFGRHCSCSLQGEYVIVGRICKPYVGQATAEEFDLMVRKGGLEINTWLRRGGDEKLFEVLKSLNRFKSYFHMHRQ
jgi:hypothetical protein